MKQNKPTAPDHVHRGPVSIAVLASANGTDLDENGFYDEIGMSAMVALREVRVAQVDELRAFLAFAARGGDRVGVEG